MTKQYILDFLNSSTVVFKDIFVKFYKLLYILLLFSVSLSAADFEWVDSIKRAKDIASKEKKNVMIMVSQKDCRSCEYMDSVVFENEQIVEYIENFFVPVKITLKEAKQKGIKAFATPTFIFLDKKYKKISRDIVGSATAQIFLQKLKEYNNLSMKTK